MAPCIQDPIASLCWRRGGGLFEKLWIDLWIYLETGVLEHARVFASLLVIAMEGQGQSALDGAPVGVVGLCLHRAGLARGLVGSASYFSSLGIHKPFQVYSWAGDVYHRDHLFPGFIRASRGEGVGGIVDVLRNINQVAPHLR